MLALYLNVTLSGGFSLSAAAEVATFQIGGREGGQCSQALLLINLTQTYLSSPHQKSTERGKKTDSKFRFTSH